jgi:hypothetical protein
MAQVMNVGGRQKEDVFSTVLKGLQIAQGVYGIRADMAQLEKMEADKQQQAQSAEERQTALAQNQALADQDRQRAAAGYISPKEKVALARDFDLSRKETPGAIKLSDDDGALFASVRKAQQKPDIRQIETTDDQGNRQLAFVEAKPGATFRAPPKTGKNGGKLTEGERTSAYHASRAADTLAVLQQIEESGYNPADIGREARGIRIPFSQYRPFQNQEDKAYEQAQREFIASVLRKETGAAVTEKEFEDYSSIYFPRPGDGDEVKAQKSAARERAVGNLIQMAGGAYDPARATPFVYKKPAEDGTAMAAPASTQKKKQDKSLYDMNEDELDQILKNLKGGM